MTNASRRMIGQVAPEAMSKDDQELDGVDVLRMVDATNVTYTAAGRKRLARRLGWSESKLYKHTELPSDRLPDEPLLSADRRGPGEVIVMAVREARRMRAPEERAAAILVEACRQLGYDCLRRVEYVSGVMCGIADSIAASAAVDEEIAQAIRDGHVDASERRRIVTRLRHRIEADRRLMSVCEDATMAEVRQIGTRQAAQK